MNVLVFFSLFVPMIRKHFQFLLCFPIKYKKVFLLHEKNWVSLIIPTCQRVLGEGRAKAGIAKALCQGSVIAVVQVFEEEQVLLLEVTQFSPGGICVRVRRGLAAAGVCASGAVEAVVVGAVRVLQDLAQANASSVARVVVEGGWAGSSVILVRGGLGREGESRECESVPQGSSLGAGRGALRACAS